MAACGTSSEVRWEDVTLELPEGWIVHEDDPGRLSVTDAPLGDEDAPGPGEAGVFIVRDPGDSAAAWRELIERRGWTLEQDEATSVGGVPATSIVYQQTGARVPTRERIVLVPSRQLTILLQPIPYGQRQDGPAIYDRHREEFDAILASLRFGAPER